MSNHIERFVHAFTFITRNNIDKRSYFFLLLQPSMTEPTRVSTFMLQSHREFRCEAYTDTLLEFADTRQAHQEFFCTNIATHIYIAAICVSRDSFLKTNSNSFKISMRAKLNLFKRVLMNLKLMRITYMCATTLKPAGGRPYVML